MIELINKYLGLIKRLGNEEHQKVVQKVVNPGDQFSPFQIKKGMVHFKPFLIIENQNETVLYSNNCVAVDVRPEVEDWILEQPLHMWKYAEEIDDCHHGMGRFLVDRELLTWMSLKWN